MFAGSYLQNTVQFSPAVNQHFLQFVIHKKTHFILLNKPSCLQFLFKCRSEFFRNRAAATAVKKNALKEISHPFFIHFRKFFYSQNLQPLAGKRNSTGLTVNKQTRQILRILQHGITEFLISEKSFMRSCCFIELPVLHQSLKHLVRVLPETTHLPVLFLRRIIKPYIVLMGTETAFFYKLRHRYLCINGSAHPYISIPLSWRGIVRRRRCQSNDCHIFHLSHKGLQSLPPLIFQMMTLIQTDRTDSGFFQPVDQLIP